jgi:hypothetical protein
MLCKLLDVSSPHMYNCCIDVQRGHMGAWKLSLREIDHGLIGGGNNPTIQQYTRIVSRIDFAKRKLCIADITFARYKSALASM